MHRQKIIFKWIFNKYDRDVECIDLDQDTGRWCALVHTDSIKAGNFLTIRVSREGHFSV